MSESIQYYENLRPEVAEFLPKKYAKVLEIGCGEGNFRGNLNGDHEYWGIEPFHECLGKAAGRLDKVLEGTYAKVSEELPDGYFDLVICNDVLEHMLEPELFLGEIKSKMGEGACLVCSIPNVRYILNVFEMIVKKDWRYKQDGILDRTHFRFFTKKSMLHMFERNGYVVEVCKGINGVGDRRNGLTGFIFRMACFCLQIILGWDIKYLQFGFRVKPK